MILDIEGVRGHRYHYGSVAALIQGIADLEKIGRGDTVATSSEIDRGKVALRNGDLTNVETAQKLIAQVMHSIPTLRREWKSDVAGFFPNVPAFLAGEPESMWRAELEESDTTPIRIWVGVMSSGAISESELVKRGTTIAALAIALSERRPVLITPYVNLGNGGRGAYGNSGAIVSWDLQSSPASLSELMANLAHPNLVRHLGWHMCHLAAQSHGTDTAGGWFPNFLNETKMRQFLGCDEQDVWLPSAMVTDDLITKPVEWINREIARHLANVEAE